MVERLPPQKPGLRARLAEDTPEDRGVKDGRLDPSAVQKGQPVLPQSGPDFAHRLLDAARARDVDGVKHLVSAWSLAQKDYTALSDGLLALSNFLRSYGANEEKPELYADVLSLDPPPPGTLFDRAALELSRASLENLSPLLNALEAIGSAVGQGHLNKQIDIQAADHGSLRAVLIANNLGLMTDALKVKMAGWNKLTEKLDRATVSFEVGIRTLPPGNTNFWVVGGVGRALEWVKSLRISPEAVSWMKAHDLFKHYPKAFFEYFMPPTDSDGLRIAGGLSRFEKDIKEVKIEALQDGEIYAGGPLMRVTGPPAAVEFLESNLMRLVTAHTTVATAAAQMTLGANGKPVAYFGPRRAPGAEDVTLGISDAAALGGMTVTSDLLAGFMGRPITGTMEHSIMLMLKTVFKHDPPRQFTAAEKARAGELLRATWKATDPNLKEDEIEAKIKAQFEDVLLEAHIFKEYALPNDRAKSVALVDTSHPNVGVAAAILAQEMVFAEVGKADENKFFAIRLDSGNLLAQGLRFHRVLKDAGMGHINILATDGLLPETVKFFEKVEKALKQASGGKPPASFYELMEQAPRSAAENEREKQEIVAMAEALAAQGGLAPNEIVFKGYGAGEKIADSVSTVGRPGIVYKASQLTFEDVEGKLVTVNMGKIPSPEKATGPNRELIARSNAEGKIVEWAIASPNEVSKLPAGWQRLMRSAYADGQIKISTALEKSVGFAAERRASLPDEIRDGGKVPIGMTAAYKAEWLDVVKKSDPTRVAEFAAYFDASWPTVQF